MYKVNPSDTGECTKLGVRHHSIIQVSGARDY